MSKPKRFSFQNVNDKNMNNFIEMLAKLSWEAIYEVLNVNTSYDYFYTEVYSVFELINN